MSVTDERRQTGRQGEDLAAEHLCADGMTIVERNWRCRHGEVDIVAAEGEGPSATLVFCEVKCRRGLGYGGPLEAITWAKTRKLRQLAAEWLATREAGRRAVRIDAIGVLWLPGRAPQIDHVRGIA